MGTGSKQRDLLKALLTEQSNLVGKALSKTRDIDQLMAARKDALRPPPGTVAGTEANLGLIQKPSSAPLPRTSPEPASPRDRHPILILVEDNPDDFMLLKRALWKTGASARVWWAKTSSEALEILAELVVTGGASICIVSDIRLPDMDGFALLKAVKSNPSASHLKFAFLTGDSAGGLQARAHASGADAFFAKPVSSEGLVETARALQKLAAYG